MPGTVLSVEHVNPNTSIKKEDENNNPMDLTTNQDDNNPLNLQKECEKLRSQVRPKLLNT
jgi:hypothetical protein